MPVPEAAKAFRRNINGLRKDIGNDLSDIAADWTKAQTNGVEKFLRKVAGLRAALTTRERPETDSILLDIWSGDDIDTALLILRAWLAGLRVLADADSSAAQPPPAGAQPSPPAAAASTSTPVPPAAPPATASAAPSPELLQLALTCAADGAAALQHLFDKAGAALRSCDDVDSQSEWDLSDKECDFIDASRRVALALVRAGALELWARALAGRAAPAEGSGQLALLGGMVRLVNHIIRCATAAEQVRRSPTQQLHMPCRACGRECVGGLPR